MPDEQTATTTAELMQMNAAPAPPPVVTKPVEPVEPIAESKPEETTAPEQNGDTPAIEDLTTEPPAYSYAFFLSDDQERADAIEESEITFEGTALLAPGDLVQWDDKVSQVTTHKVLLVSAKGDAHFDVIIDFNEYDEDAKLSEEGGLPDEEAPAPPAPVDSSGTWKGYTKDGHAVEIRKNEDGTVTCRPASHAGPQFDAASVEEALAQVPKLA